MIKCRPAVDKGGEMRRRCRAAGRAREPGHGGRQGRPGLGPRSPAGAPSLSPAPRPIPSKPEDRRAVCLSESHGAIGAIKTLLMMNCRRPAAAAAGDSDSETVRVRVSGGRGRQWHHDTPAGGTWNPGPGAWPPA